MDLNASSRSSGCERDPLAERLPELAWDDEASGRRVRGPLGRMAVEVLLLPRLWLSTTRSQTSPCNGGGALGRDSGRVVQRQVRSLPMIKMATADVAGRGNWSLRGSATHATAWITARSMGTLWNDRPRDDAHARRRSSLAPLAGARAFGDSKLVRAAHADATPRWETQGVGGKEAPVSTSIGL